MGDYGRQRETTGDNGRQRLGQRISERSVHRPGLKLYIEPYRQSCFRESSELNQQNKNHEKSLQDKLVQKEIRSSSRNGPGPTHRGLIWGLYMAPHMGSQIYDMVCYDTI